MRLRRLAASAALVLGCVATPAFVGAPVASADSVDCQFYLYFKSYSGFFVDHACVEGEEDTEFCEYVLGQLGVSPQEVIDEACRLAALP